MNIERTGHSEHTGHGAAAPYPASSEVDHEDIFTVLPQYENQKQTGPGLTKRAETPADKSKQRLENLAKARAVRTQRAKERQEALKELVETKQALTVRERKLVAKAAHEAKLKAIKLLAGTDVAKPEPEIEEQAQPEPKQKTPRAPKAQLEPVQVQAQIQAQVQAQVQTPPKQRPSLASYGF
jgi:hypothetical protein